MNWNKEVSFIALVVSLAGCTSSPPQLSPSPSPEIAPSEVVCPSGECLPLGDLAGWRQIYTDDFAEPVELGGWSDCSMDPMICRGLPEAYRGRWWAFLEGWTDQANGLYSPARTLSIADGVMDVFVHTVGGVHLAAAPVPLIHGRNGALGQLYGRYAVRFAADSLHGYKVAWLLWPDSETWPRDGEIDFPEGNLDGIIEAYMHRRNAAAGNDAAGFSSGVPLSGAWHTAVIEWKKDSVVFVLDGRVVGATMDRIPDTPMHWVLEVTTALDGTVPSDGASGHVRIDWVAVWEKTNG